MELWVWSLILFGIALILFAVELFIPSGGVIGLLCLAALIGAIITAFMTDSTFGVVALFCALAAIPLGFLAFLRVFPDTPIARWMTLTNEGVSLADEETEDAGRTSASQARREMVGVEGEALTDLRPIGVCKLDGKRVDCLAEGGVIESGSRVRVVAADGMQVKVRRV